MTTQKKATAAGLRRVVARLEEMASLVQYQHPSLGINEKVALDFAYRCDALSDFLTKRAEETPEEKEEPKVGDKAEETTAKQANTTATPAAGHFPPHSIGQKVSGPLQAEADESYMKGHFTQEIFAALSDKQMSGALATAAAAHRADPKMAALAAKAAVAAAAAVFAASAKQAGDEDAPAAPKTDSADKTEDEAAAKKAGEDTKTEESAESESEGDKAASTFGLYSAR